MEKTLKNDLKVQLIDYLRKLKNATKEKTLALKKDDVRFISDFVERSSLDAHQAMTLIFTDRETLAIRNIEDAIARIDKGIFGICEECGNEIHKERLASFPSSRLCISCQGEKEKVSRKYFAGGLSAHLHSSGLSAVKTGSGTFG
jgi:DnaK suppressor protein